MVSAWFATDLVGWAILVRVEEQSERGREKVRKNLLFARRENSPASQARDEDLPRRGGEILKRLLASELATS